MLTEISAKVIADSISPFNVRLVTLELEYPRFIHSEFMTHRVFSRNAGSSRAIPISKMIERVKKDPAMPVHWGSNQPGMQAGEEVSAIRGAHERWEAAAHSAVEEAKTLDQLGLHKQIVNRVLEPFAWIKVLVTATEWDNFFELRDHEDAQPEIRALAVEMQNAMDASIKHRVPRGGWHLPYIGAKEWDNHDSDTLIKFSVARCARVSYLNHDKTFPDYKKDLDLYDKLVGSRPMHASPTEHQATPINSAAHFVKNFRGWQQHRVYLET